MKFLRTTIILSLGLIILATGCKVRKTESRIQSDESGAARINQTFGPFADMIGHRLPDLKTGFDNLVTRITANRDLSRSLCLDSMDGFSFELGVGGSALAKISSGVSFTYNGGGYDVACTVSGGLESSTELVKKVSFSRSLGQCNSGDQMVVTLAAGPSAKYGFGGSAVLTYDVGISKGAISRLLEGVSEESQKYLARGLLNQELAIDQVSPDTCAQLTTSMAESVGTYPAIIQEALINIVNKGTGCDVSADDIQSTNSESQSICEQISLKAAVTAINNSVADSTNAGAQILASLTNGLKEALSGCDGIGIELDVGMGFSPGFEASISVKSTSTIGSFSPNLSELDAAVQQAIASSSTNDQISDDVRSTCNSISSRIGRGKTICDLYGKLDEIKDGLGYLPQIVASFDGELDSLDYELIAGQKISSASLPDPIEIPFICAVRAAKTITETALWDIPGI